MEVSGRCIDKRRIRQQIIRLGATGNSQPCQISNVIPDGACTNKIQDSITTGIKEIVDRVIENARRAGTVCLCANTDRLEVIRKPCRPAVVDNIIVNEMPTAWDTDVNGARISLSV